MRPMTAWMTVPVKRHGRHHLQLGKQYHHSTRSSLIRCPIVTTFTTSHSSYSKTNFQKTKSWNVNSAVFSTLSDAAAIKTNDDEDENFFHLNNIQTAAATTRDAKEEEIKLKSKPKPNGNWDTSSPLAWCSTFGSRTSEHENRYKSLAKLSPGDEGYFDVSGTETHPPKVTVVRTKEQALQVLQKLYEAPPDIIHACDTEVMDIDVKSVGPVGNGYVTCLSIYSGPDFDYGLGLEKGSVLWIDNLDDAYGVLQYFKDWLQDERYLKVWHNYGFDRHVLWNEGINVQGFGGDTMHMARLQDTSRSKATSFKNATGYGLEALSNDLLEMRKRPMKELFGVPRLRADGSEGAILDIPPVEVLQRDPQFRSRWILYSAYDAESTYKLYHVLKSKLQQMDWIQGDSLFEYYHSNMRKFGEVLTDMERRGIRVNAVDYLANVELQARADRKQHIETFLKWASTKTGIGPYGLALNLASSVQLCTYLFGGCVNQKTKEKTEDVRVFRVAREEMSEEAYKAIREWEEEEKKRNEESGGGEGGVLGDENDAEKQQKDEFDFMNASQLKRICKERNLKVSGKKEELQERLRGHFLAAATTSATSLHPETMTSTSPKTTTEHDFKKMLKKDLTDLCKEHQLKVSGNKADLIGRLEEYFDSIEPPQQLEVQEEKESIMNKLSPTNLSPPPLSSFEDYDSMSDDDIRDACTARGVPDTGSRKTLINRLREDSAFVLEILSASSPKDYDGYQNLAAQLEKESRKDEVLADILREVKAKTEEESKWVDVVVRSIGMEPIKFTAGGAPSVTADVLKKLAGDPYENPPKYGTAYEFFGGGDAGHEACEAFYSLTMVGSIDTMIANFLTSLQSLADEQSRVHCSLNLNTDTGRLSSRMPNLQNQPALEKDKYKIRKSFEASPGNNLIVADYGQLELRLLASMTKCTSMIEAFEMGGDFHSRTALGMFDYIQKAVKDGECLLEWDYSKGEPPKPMLKDLYASERRKAKTLNFSIAYGKTAHGLSQDWGVSQQEAQDMLQKWYDSRPEVLDWQDQTKANARRFGITRTLMGRYRQLPDAMDKKNWRNVGRAERASINTPIQGGAADVAMMAMIKINDSPILKKLGWILLLQIHDEVILEGPEETAEEAFEEVIKCMENPWVYGLDKTAVPLLVDGSYIHKNWYDAK